jgi:hypothetical protein
MTATECSLPVFITSKLEADEDLLGLAIDIGVPLAQLGGHTVVDALEDAAVLVPVAFPVPAVLVAVAVCLDARDLAFDSRHGDVEVVVGAGTGVAALKAGDVPCPVSGMAIWRSCTTGFASAPAEAAEKARSMVDETIADRMRL